MAQSSSRRLTAIELDSLVRGLFTSQVDYRTPRPEEVRLSQDFIRRAIAFQTQTVSPDALVQVHIQDSVHLITLDQLLAWCALPSPDRMVIGVVHDGPRVAHARLAISIYRGGRPPEVSISDRDL